MRGGSSPEEVLPVSDALGAAVAIGRTVSESRQRRQMSHLPPSLISAIGIQSSDVSGVVPPALAAVLSDSGYWMDLVCTMGFDVSVYRDTQMNLEVLSRYFDSTQQGLLRVFQMFDKDNDGNISFAEVARGLRQQAMYTLQGSTSADRAFHELCVLMESEPESGVARPPGFLAALRNLRLAAIMASMRGLVGGLGSVRWPIAEEQDSSADDLEAGLGSCSKGKNGLSRHRSVGHIACTGAHTSESAGIDLRICLHEYREDQLYASSPVTRPISFLFQNNSSSFGDLPLLSVQEALSASGSIPQSLSADCIGFTPKGTVKTGERLSIPGLSSSVSALQVKWVHAHEPSSRAVLGLAVKYGLDPRFVLDVATLWRETGKIDQATGYTDLAGGMESHHQATASGSGTVAGSGALHTGGVLGSGLGGQSLSHSVVPKPLWIFLVLPVLRLTNSSESTLRPFQLWRRQVQRTRKARAALSRGLTKDDVGAKKGKSAQGSISASHYVEPPSIYICLEHCNLALFATGQADGGTALSFTSEWAVLARLSTHDPKSDEGDDSDVSVFVRMTAWMKRMSGHVARTTFFRQRADSFTQSEMPPPESHQIPHTSSEHDVARVSIGRGSGGTGMAMGGRVSPPSGLGISPAGVGAYPAGVGTSPAVVGLSSSSAGISPGLGAVSPIAESLRKTDRDNSSTAYSGVSEKSGWVADAVGTTHSSDSSWSARDRGHSRNRNHGNGHGQAHGHRHSHGNHAHSHGNHTHGQNHAHGNQSHHPSPLASPSDLQQDDDLAMFSKVLAQLKTSYSKIRTGDAHTLLLKILCDVTEGYLQVAEAYEGAVHLIQRRLDREKDNVAQKDVRRLQKMITQLSQLYRTVRPVSGIVDSLTTKPLSGDAQLYISDIRSNVTRFLDDVSAIKDVAKGMSEQYHQYSQHKTSSVLYLLTLVTSFFVPGQFLASLYGMNFKDPETGEPGLPELSWKYGYLYFWCLMIAVSAVVFIYYRRKRWI